MRHLRRTTLAYLRKSTCACSGSLERVCWYRRFYFGEGLYYKESALLARQPVVLRSTVHASMGPNRHLFGKTVWKIRKHSSSPTLVVPGQKNRYRKDVRSVVVLHAGRVQVFPGTSVSLILKSEVRLAAETTEKALKSVFTVLSSCQKPDVITDAHTG